MEKVANIDIAKGLRNSGPKVGTMRCEKPNHEKNYCKYLCLSKDCKKNRVTCAHCFIEDHVVHNKVKMTIEEFENSFKEKYAELAEIVTELGFSRYHSSKESELTDIYKRFDVLKVDMCAKLDDIRDKIIDDFQKVVFTTDVEAVRDLARKIVENNSSLQVTDFKAIGEDEILKFIDMYSETFLEDEDILGKLCVIQTNVRVSFGQLMNNIDKFSRNIGYDFDERLVPVMQITLDDNFAAGRYRIFHKGCSDFPLLKFVPIFPCCNKAYPCAKCHDKTEKHKAKPALQVYCIKCKFMQDNQYSLLKCPRCIDYVDKL